MTCTAGFIWDTPQIFNRLITDCGVACEHVTPYLMAAPFYRGRFVAIIIPTGFANPQYSKLMPALTVSAPRIKHFIEKGGRLLVFGGGAGREDAYSWLPFHLTYHHVYGARRLRFEENNPYASILADYDAEAGVECDGWFSDCDGDVLAATEDGKPVMLCREVGDGIVIVTAIHEYPSRTFLRSFCCGARETLF